MLYNKLKRHPKMFCFLAVLDTSVGHTMDVLSQFISVLCHCDGLFHGESCPWARFSKLLKKILGK